MARILCPACFGYALLTGKDPERARLGTMKDHVNRAVLIAHGREELCVGSQRAVWDLYATETVMHVINNDGTKSLPGLLKDYPPDPG